MLEGLSKKKKIKKKPPKKRKKAPKQTKGLTDRVKQLNWESRKRIFKYISEGYTMKNVARKLNVDRTTIYRWIQKDSNLKILVKEAREIRAGDYADEIVGISDNNEGDLIVDENTGRAYPNAANVARSALRIKARKSMAALLHPKKYGEQKKLEINKEGFIGFVGLQIIPPKQPDLIDDEDVIDVDQE